MDALLSFILIYFKISFQAEEAQKVVSKGTYYLILLRRTGAMKQ